MWLKASISFYLLELCFLYSSNVQAEKKCLLPPHPASGHWSLVTNIGIKTTRVPHLTILRVACGETYKLDGCEMTVCMDGQWVPPIGKCLRTCDSIFSTSTLQVTCFYKEQETKNCTKPLDGSIAKFKCESYYEDLRLIKSNAVCLDGKWSEDIPECTPICGKATIEPAPTLVIGGKTAKKGQFPWQVALYTIHDKVLNCGGSLLSEKIVVTAAHCVTDTEGVKLPKEDYLVVAGKHFRKLDHSGDLKYAQRSEVHEIYVPDYYEGEYQNYLGDISIIVTKQNFFFSPRVQPACIDWTKKFEGNLLDGPRHGYVSGWGYTKRTKDPSDELKHLKVPIIPTKECKRIVSDTYKEYVTLDKFCAGFRDNGTSVCSGDSGGGLVFRHGTRYYLTGVVSLAPLLQEGAGGCNSDEYGIYTFVYNYTDDFILRAIAKYKPSSTPEEPEEQQPPTTTTTQQPVPSTSEKIPSGLCTIPESTKNGKWKLINADHEELPKYVRSSSVLSLECKKGFAVQGYNLTVCFEGSWSSPFGRCAKTCSPLISSTETTINCTLDGKEVNCSMAFENTVAHVNCAPYYEATSRNTRPVICLDGSWSSPISRCVPICGSGIHSKVPPWFASIHKVDEKESMQICRGTLINPSTVLTGAHCVTSNTGELKDPSSYIVSVGSDDLRSADVQISKVKKIYIPSEYAGSIQNFLGDFAKLTLEKEFRFSKLVQPVCINWGGRASTDTVVFVVGSLYDQSEARIGLQLKELKLLATDDCIKTESEGTVPIYLTKDKICGIANGNYTFCQGDGGAGVVERRLGKYFLIGISSVGFPKKGGSKGLCGVSIMLFTDVGQFLEDIV